MQHINKVTIVALIVGIFAGWALWGRSPETAHHTMPDGTSMAGQMDMTSMMADMNAALAGKSGDEFDKAFIDEMIVHHQGAIDMAILARTSAKHQEIKTLAEAIITAQTKEIDQMKSWQRSWYSQ